MNNVRDFGAVGDGKNKDTASIQKAIDEGGMVFFPPGIYLSGTLYLKSNGGLELAPGAVLLASPDRADYNTDDFCEQNAVFTSENVSGAHFIVAVEQQNIVIRGGGRIDGNRKAFYNISEHSLEVWDEESWRYLATHWRPGQMVFFCECENVTLDGVEMFNPPYWSCFLHGCEHVTIRGLRNWNDYGTHNGDGLDIDCCRFVTISDCIICSGDDCITLRGDERRLKHKKACEYITVSNCILSTKRCNAFRIGVGNGIVRNCAVSNIIIHDTRTGIQINSRYGRNSEGVTIENIRFSGIQFHGNRPLAIESDVNGIHDDPVKKIRNISFCDFHGDAKWSCLLESNHRGDIQGISFRNVEFCYHGGEDIEEGEEIRYAEFAAKNSPAAFHATNVEELSFHDVRIQWETRCPQWKYGVLAINSEVSENNCDFGKICKM